MARQRFIWPDLWSDPGFASLTPIAKVLYIGCFSNADDEGRLLGDVPYLRSLIFGRNANNALRVPTARAQMLNAMPKLRHYVVDGVEYLAFTNWSEWQKPKYPSPSRIPPPPDDSGKRSGNDSGRSSGNDSPTGWVGKEGQDHKPQLDPKAAARHLKSIKSTTEASSEEPDLENPETPAAAVAPPTEQTIRAACARFGSDLNIAEPLARQLTADGFNRLVAKMDGKVKRGSVREAAGHFVFLLQREVGSERKRQAAAIAAPNREATRLPEADRPRPITGDEWVRRVVPTLAVHPFERVEKFVRDQATVEGWTDEETTERLELARTIHSESGEPDLDAPAA